MNDPRDSMSSTDFQQLVSTFDSICANERRQRDDWKDPSRERIAALEEALKAAEELVSERWVENENPVDDSPGEFYCTSCYQFKDEPHTDRCKWLAFDAAVARCKETR